MASNNNENQPTSSNDHNAEDGPVGCYLVYDPTSSGRLVLHYSQGVVPTNAVGFFCTTDAIPAFKFQRPSTLIAGILGGDVGKRKYYNGWCQFLKQATKYSDARVICFHAAQGLAVDVYAFCHATNSCRYLDLRAGLTLLEPLSAVAVVPQHKQFLKGVKTMNASNFLELGNIAGASTKM